MRIIFYVTRNKMFKMCVLYRNLANVSVETLFNQQRKWNTKSHIKRRLMIFTLMRNPKGVDYGWMERRNWEHTITHGLKWVSTVQRELTHFLSVSWTHETSPSLTQVHCAGWPLGKIRNASKANLSDSAFLSSPEEDWGRCSNASSFLGPDGFSKESLDLVSIHWRAKKREKESVKTHQNTAPWTLQRV